MNDNSLTDIVKSRREAGEGVFSSLGGAAKERLKEKLDFKRILPQGGLLTALFPKLKAYKAQKAASPEDRVLKNIDTDFKLFAKNSKKLSSISSNFLVMKKEVNKFAKSQNVRPAIYVNERTDSVTSGSLNETTPSYMKSGKENNMILMISALALAIAVGYETLKKSFDNSIEKLIGSLPNLGNNIYDKLKESFENMDFTKFIQDNASKINDEIKNSFDDAKDKIINSEIAKKIKNAVSGREQGVDDTITPTNATPKSSKDGATSQPFQGSQKEFYDNMYATLLSEATKQGVENPEAIARVGAAQSVIETGYGQALAGGNNYFGIKSRPGEGGTEQQTQEFINGKMVTINDKFRKYNNMKESAADYVKFLKENGLYKKTLAAKTVDEAILAIGSSGYATDPEYTKKIQAVNASGMAGNIPGSSKIAQSTNTSPAKVGKVSTEFPTWSESMQSYGEMKKVEGAVIHHTGGGSMSGAIETLKQNGLSYHYMIDKGGNVKQLIPGKGVGYHAGYGPNQSTFGIALVAEDDSKVTSEQIQVATNLNAKLASEYGYDPKNVFGHGEISKNKMATEGKTVVDLITKSFSSIKDQSLLLLLRAGADLNYKNEESVANFENQKKSFHSNKEKNQRIASNDPDVLPYLLDRLSNNSG